MKNAVVRFIRENDGNVNGKGEPSKGRPVGVVVGFTEPGVNSPKIGYAFWRPSGKIDRRILVELAAGRALLGQNHEIPNRRLELPDCPGVFVSLEGTVSGTVALVRKDLNEKRFRVS